MMCSNRLFVFVYIRRFILALQILIIYPEGRAVYMQSDLVTLQVTFFFKSWLKKKKAIQPTCPVCCILWDVQICGLLYTCLLFEPYVCIISGKNIFRKILGVSSYLVPQNATLLDIWPNPMGQANSVSAEQSDDFSLLSVTQIVSIRKLCISHFCIDD